MVSSSASAHAYGAIARSISSDNRPMVASAVSMRGEHLGGQQAVVAVEVAPQRGPQLGELDAQAPLGQLGHGGGVTAAPDEGSQHRPAGHPQDVAGHRRQLDARVFEHLLQALGLAGALLDDDLAVAGEVTQLADRAWWHEARADQAVLDQLADPGRVADVGLAAGDVAQVVGVEQPALQVVFQQVVHLSSRRRWTPCRPRAPGGRTASPAAPTARRSWSRRCGSPGGAPPVGQAPGRRPRRSSCARPARRSARSTCPSTPPGSVAVARPEEPPCKESQVACSQQHFGVPEAPASDCCTGSPAPRLSDVAGRAPQFSSVQGGPAGHGRLLRRSS